MRFRFIVLISACAYFASISAVICQSSGRRTSGLQPISIGGRVPLGFTGHKITEIIHVLEASDVSRPKSEFETTEAYEKRGEEFLLRQPDLLVVLQERSGLYASYDADLQALSFTLMMDPFAQGEIGEGEAVLLNTNQVGARQYRGTNAFGVSTMVIEQRFRDFGLLIQGNTFAGSFSLAMPAKVAQLTKPHLLLLLRCRLKDPFVHTHTSYSKPTLEVPMETYREGLFVRVSPIELSVFDDQTGEILKTFSENDESINRRAGEVNRVQKEDAQRHNLERTETSKLRPSVVEKIPPIYPTLAKTAGIEGDVRLNVTVTADGSIRGITLISGHPLLVQAAQDAVRHWKFCAGTVAGVTKEMSTEIDIPFRLQP